jgi:hypothetical protein
MNQEALTYTGTASPNNNRPDCGHRQAFRLRERLAGSPAVLLLRKRTATRPRESSERYSDDEIGMKNE